jgi:hypothetical protein
MSILFFLFVLLLAPPAVAQGTGGSFPTPAGPTVSGVAILNPTGPITNGQPVMGPPTLANRSRWCAPHALRQHRSERRVIRSWHYRIDGSIPIIDRAEQRRRACSFQNQGTHDMTIRVVGASVGQKYRPMA